MFCPMCGNQLEDGSARCSRCEHLLTPEWMPVFPEPEDRVFSPEPETQMCEPEVEEQPQFQEPEAPALYPEEDARVFSPEPEILADYPEPAEQDLFSEFLPETEEREFLPEDEDRDLFSELEEQDIFAGLEEETASLPPEAPEQPRKKAPGKTRRLLKKLLTAAALTTAAAALVCGAVFAMSRKPFTLQSGTCYLLPGEGENFRILTDGGTVLTAEGTAAEVLSSLDGGVQAVRTREGGCILLRNGQVVPVEDKVACMALSADGRTLAWISESLVLTVCDTETMQTRRVDKKVHGISLSPDGKSLAYYTLDDDGTYVAWLWSGEESARLAEDRIPFALSNGGKYIYCHGDDPGELYVLSSRGDSLRLATDMDPECGVQLNADHTEFLFTAGDGIWLSCDGKEAVRLGEGALQLLLPGNCGPIRQQGSGFAVITLPAARLGGHYYTDGTGLFWMSGKGTLHHLAISAAQARVSADGRTVFWLDGERNLWTVERGALNLPRLLAGDVTAFAVGETGGLYFTDTNRTLWYRGERAVARPVSEGADAPILTQDGSCLFFTDRAEGTGILWQCANGAQPVPLIRASNAEILAGITLITGEDGRLYILTETGCESLSE